ncbi:ATP-binding protein [Streptomyces sp. NBC_01465]|uniref:ATP-binding protein n=1 Tax=Streptomyces sp. NBC_01465 TaxID=2903878 RepID=UPI002E35607C|nr:ATP-binding protein [Streptomyces sp. NBC_01465]
MTAPPEGYAPHPHIGGRTAALRALAAWRMEWPGAPRVLLLTGGAGSGSSRLITGFLMLCDPEFRGRLPLDDMDPSTVPPDLPAPAVPGPEGRTAAQVLWLLAEHFGLSAARTDEVYEQLAGLEQPVTVVVPDVDLAGPVRGAGEPARLVREVLKPLAATATVRLLVDIPREYAAELAGALPPGEVQVLDLDDPQWADQEGLALHAEAALDPQLGAPELPFTADPAVRRALAEAVARRAGNSPLVVQLAVQCLLMAPEGFDPDDASVLPSSVDEALDLHAQRLGADPQTLRLMLAPLALAGSDGLPVALWGELAAAVAGRDMSEDIAGGMLLAGPFVQPEEDRLRLLHPAVGAAVRAGLPDLRAAQSRVAVALLSTVPGQDWGKADPYVRDHIAGHALESGQLPQLLTDPGLFAHADPVVLRAAVEACEPGELGAPALTYLRTAPLLTRTQAPAELRAALLETAFAEDGLYEYAAAVHRLGFELPWQTLWSVRVPDVSAVTVGRLPESGQQVAALVVPAGTPGSLPLGESGAVSIYGLTQPVELPADTDPARIERPTEDERAEAPLFLSRGADYLRVWDRASEEIVAALVSDVPFTAADLSPDGVLVVATERGAKALRVRAPHLTH